MCGKTSYDRLFGSLGLFRDLLFLDFKSTASTHSATPARLLDFSPVKTLASFSAPSVPWDSSFGVQKELALCFLALRRATYKLLFKGVSGFCPLLLSPVYMILCLQSISRPLEYVIPLLNIQQHDTQPHQKNTGDFWARE